MSSTDDISGKAERLSVAITAILSIIRILRELLKRAP